MGDLVELNRYRRPRRPATIYFSRRELTALLSLFSRRVLLGEWRDYTIDNSEAFAAFCVYRRAHDAPLYQIMRLAPASHPKGDYVVVRAGTRICRGKSLAEVLTALNSPLRAVRG